MNGRFGNGADNRGTRKDGGWGNEEVRGSLYTGVSPRGGSLRTGGGGRGGNTLCLKLGIGGKGGSVLMSGAGGKGGNIFLKSGVGGKGGNPLSCSAEGGNVAWGVENCGRRLTSDGVNSTSPTVCCDWFSTDSESRGNNGRTAKSSP